jgi:hypothetical protein
MARVPILWIAEFPAGLDAAKACPGLTSWSRSTPSGCGRRAEENKTLARVVKPSDVRLPTLIVADRRLGDMA